jgi:hypothetical protein
MILMVLFDSYSVLKWAFATYLSLIGPSRLSRYVMCVSTVEAVLWLEPKNFL